MRETFKNAVIQNIGKIIAGLIVTTLIGVFTTIVIEPVKQVANMPGEVKEWQQSFEQKQLQFESRQMQFLNTLEKQTQTDSVIYKQLERINQSNDLIETEMVVVKTKIATIRDELPALHQRFNDIENTVKNAKELGNFAQQTPHSKFIERFSQRRQQKEWQRHSKYYDKIRSRNPRLMLLDSLDNAQSLNIAYQSSFNSYYNEQQTTN